MQARRRNGVGRRVGGWAWEEEPYGVGVVLYLFYILNLDYILRFGMVFCGAGYALTGIRLARRSIGLRQYARR